MSDPRDVDPRQIDSAAIVLAGGRASRLGGASKALLRVGGRPALARVVRALLDAGRSRVVVVGPAGEVAEALEGVPDAAGADARVRTTIERDRFGGPAVAVAAGVAALVEHGVAPAALVDVLACDLRKPAELVGALDATERIRNHDGLVLVDADGREQWLASRIRLERLRCALAQARPGDALRRHLGELALARVPAPAGATLDLDTPADLAAAGAVVHLGTGPRCC